MYINLRYDWPLHFVLLLTNWLPDNVFSLKLRGFLASPFFGKCGRNLRLGRGITFYNPRNIEIGRDVYIAKGCWLLGSSSIVIESEVMFGPYCVVVTGNHSSINGSYRYGPICDLKPVRIGFGSWVSAHCTILPGVQIGKNGLLAANSTLNVNIEANCIYGGVPARRLK